MYLKRLSSNYPNLSKWESKNVKWPKCRSVCLAKYLYIELRSLEYCKSVAFYSYFKSFIRIIAFFFSKQFYTSLADDFLVKRRGCSSSYLPKPYVNLLLFEQFQLLQSSFWNTHPLSWSEGCFVLSKFFVDESNSLTLISFNWYWTRQTEKQAKCRTFKVETEPSRLLHLVN